MGWPAVCVVRASCVRRESAGAHLTVTAFVGGLDD